MKPTVRASSVEGLRREIKDLRRSVMDLQRQGSPVQSDREYALGDLSDVDTATTAPNDGDTLVYDSASGLWLPGAASGGPGGSVECFRYYSGTITPADFTYISWTGGEEYATAGISLAPITNPDELFELPSGLWSISANFIIYPDTTAPTSGRWKAGIGATAQGGFDVSMVASQLPTSSSACHLSVTFDFYDDGTTATPGFSVLVRDSLDQTVLVDATVSGHRVAESI